TPSVTVGGNPAGNPPRRKEGSPANAAGLLNRRLTSRHGARYRQRIVRHFAVDRLPVTCGGAAVSNAHKIVYGASAMLAAAPLVALAVGQQDRAPILTFLAVAASLAFVGLAAACLRQSCRLRESQDALRLQNSRLDA